MIALVIIRRTHKAHRTDRGAENPTGPKLPDFTLLEGKQCRSRGGGSLPHQDLRYLQIQQFSSLVVKELNK